jgi:ATP diphosphatase
MVRRHPHVFGDTPDERTADELIENWERMKSAERAARPGRGGALAGVAIGLPALTRAVKLQARAARAGFDLPEADALVDTIAEVTVGLVGAGTGGEPDRLAEDYGELMFAMANLARQLEIDPEAALRAANARFIGRFEAAEARLAADDPAAPEEPA